MQKERRPKLEEVQEDLVGYALAKLKLNSIWVG